MHCCMLGSESVQVLGFRVQRFRVEDQNALCSCLPVCWFSGLVLRVPSSLSQSIGCHTMVEATQGKVPTLWGVRLRSNYVSKRCTLTPGLHGMPQTRNLQAQLLYGTEMNPGSRMNLNPKPETLRPNPYINPKIIPQVRPHLLRSPLARVHRMRTSQAVSTGQCPTLHRP